MINRLDRLADSMLETSKSNGDPILIAQFVRRNPIHAFATRIR